MSKHKSTSSATTHPAEPAIGQLTEASSEAALAAPDATQPTREDRIRQGAFALYQARHGEDGSAEEDWLQAERALDQGTGLLMA